MNIKVVCLNLWRGGVLLDGILKFLVAEDADVLFLQEVYAATDPTLPDNYRSLEVLQAALQYPYYDFAPAVLDRLPEAKVDNGNAIFSKFPITAHDTVFFNEPYGERDALDPKTYPGTPRNLQKVVIDVANQPVSLFNLQGVWDLDGDNYSPKRQHMSEVIIEAIAHQPQVILAGDTNARTTNKAILAIEDHLSSVFARELDTTFNMRRKDNPGYATSSVDMIFVSPTITVLEKSCPDVDISDHLPLIASLRLA
jgi:endonuclease/exonuclease/phosphatase family metal-dependent hydrolase